MLKILPASAAAPAVEFLSDIRVPLQVCDYHKAQRRLMVTSEFCAGTFPRQFFVVSHHTGKEVRFTVVGPEDKLYDEDQWDGEQQVYRPVGDVPNVDHLVMWHAW